MLIMVHNDLFKITTQDDINMILEKISDSIVILDPKDNEIIYFNKSTYESLGYTKEEFTEVGPNYFLRQNSKATINKTHQKVLSGKTITLRSKHITKNGNIQFADITLSPISISNKTYICAIWKDITHHVMNDRAMSEKNRRLSRFLDILSQLNNSQEFLNSDIPKFSQLATPLISSALDIDRVSIRLYNHDDSELVSVSLFDRNHKDKLKALTLKRTEYSDFFNYMETNPFIVVEDIRKNSSFEGMFKVFFSLHGLINSILITQIRVNTKIYGYIILQSKLNTSWDKEYIVFASQIADQIGIMIIESELKKQQAMLERKVEERTKALEHAKNIAESATLSKTRFLSNMSHEIRTPLNAIIGFLSLLELDKLDSKNKLYIDQINEGSKNLLNIINDVLDISKMESGKLEVHYDQIDLEQLIEKKANFYHDLFKTQNLAFEVSYKCIHKQYYTDQNLLNMILNNLLSNALKYTKVGSVFLSVNEKIISSIESQIIIEVADTGIGIQKKNFSKIFNVFEQIVQVNQFDYKGSGLGLALTKQVVELLNGTISFRSSYQKGSTFIVTLPMKHEAINYISPSKQTKEDISQNYSFKDKRILLIDDNKLNQSMILNFYADTGALIDVVSNGYEAIKYIEGYTYDLVFMDLHMPGLDGMKTTQLIRMNPKHQRLPIIALSADAYQRIKKDENKELFDDFVLKPVQKDLILKTTHTFFNNPNTKKRKQILDSWLNNLERYAALFVKDGMYYVANNEYLYAAILNEFTTNHQNDLDQLLIALKSDHAYAHRIVHTLKSLLKTIGMNEIYEFMIEIYELMQLNHSNNYLFELIEKTNVAFKNQVFLIKYICQIYKHQGELRS